MTVFSIWDAYSFHTVGIVAAASSEEALEIANETYATPLDHDYEAVGPFQLVAPSLLQKIADWKADDDQVTGIDLLFEIQNELEVGLEV